MFDTVLIADNVLNVLRHAESRAPSVAEQRAFERERRIRVKALAEGGVQSRIMRTVEDMAVIRVEGVLTPRPSLFAWIFGPGNTSYQEIQESLFAAQESPRIRSAVLVVDSPGGTVAGLFETFAALDSFKKSGKPIRVLATQATSAAYGLAAAAGPISAVNEASVFGSIGVAASFFVSSYIVDIASTEAPDKRPDVRTPEGQAVIRRYLDQLHELFVEQIAAGRSTSAEVVNERFGRGASLVAKDALRRRMIDSIASAKQPAQPPPPKPPARETSTVVSTPYRPPLPEGCANEVEAADLWLAQMRVIQALPPHRRTAKDVRTALRSVAKPTTMTPPSRATSTEGRPTTAPTLLDRFAADLPPRKE